MKKLYNNIIYHLLLICIIITSCKNETQDNLILESKLTIQSISLENDEDPISINDLKENSNNINKSAALVKNSITNEDLNLEQSTMVYSTEFDALVDINENNLFSSNKNSNTSKLNKNYKIAIDQPIGNDIKFRLIIYKQSNLTKPIYNSVLSKGNQPNISLIPGISYKWFAYSINETTVPNINSDGTIEKSDIANKDFMFASNTLTPSIGENYLQIIFKRQVSRLEVTLNTRGIFGPMRDNSNISIGRGTGTSFTNLIQTGDFNIQTGLFTDIEEITSGISASEMTIVDSRWANAEKKAIFYSVENSNRTISANNLRVRINALSITLDDATIRTFNNNTLVPINHASSLEISKGKIAKINVRLIENGILVNGLYWARTNLIYDASKLYGGSYTSTTSDAYRFRPNNNYVTPSNNEYWNQGSTTPTGTDYNSVDICTRVYPQSTWRKPTGVEFDNLIAQNSVIKTKYSLGNNTYQYILTWERSATQNANSAFPDNNLNLPFFGYRNTSGTIVQRPNGANDATGQLRYASRNYVSGTGDAHVLTANVTNGAFSGNLTNTTLANTNGLSIRCVRNTINN